jgi:hypothetical protein
MHDWIIKGGRVVDPANDIEFLIEQIEQIARVFARAEIPFQAAVEGPGSG